jgi:hypothetical protein
MNIFLKVYKIKSILSIHAQLVLSFFPALFKGKINVKFLLASLKTHLTAKIVPKAV